MEQSAWATSLSMSFKGDYSAVTQTFAVLVSYSFHSWLLILQEFSVCVDLIPNGGLIIVFAMSNVVVNFGRDIL